jgi:hypothetical protein
MKDGDPIYAVVPTTMRRVWEGTLAGDNATFSIDLTREENLGQTLGKPGYLDILLACGVVRLPIRGGDAPEIWICGDRRRLIEEVRYHFTEKAIEARQMQRRAYSL